MDEGQSQATIHMLAYPLSITTYFFTTYSSDLIVLLVERGRLLVVAMGISIKYYTHSKIHVLL